MSCYQKVGVESWKESPEICISHLRCTKINGENDRERQSGWAQNPRSQSKGLVSVLSWQDNVYFLNCGSQPHMESRNWMSGRPNRSKQSKWLLNDQRSIQSQTWGGSPVFLTELAWAALYLHHSLAFEHTALVCALCIVHASHCATLTTTTDHLSSDGRVR